MNEKVSENIEGLAARLMILRDSIKITNVEFLKLLIEALTACFNMGKEYAKHERRGLQSTGGAAGDTNQKERRQ